MACPKAKNEEGWEVYVTRTRAGYTAESAEGFAHEEHALRVHLEAIVENEERDRATRERAHDTRPSERARGYLLLTPALVTRARRENDQRNAARDFARAEAARTAARNDGYSCSKLDAEGV